MKFVKEGDTVKRVSVKLIDFGGSGFHRGPLPLVQSPAYSPLPDSSVLPKLPRHTADTIATSLSIANVMCGSMFWDWIPKRGANFVDPRMFPRWGGGWHALGSCGRPSVLLDKDMDCQGYVLVQGVLEVIREGLFVEDRGTKGMIVPRGSRPSRLLHVLAKHMDKETFGLLPHRTQAVMLEAVEKEDPGDERKLQSAVADGEGAAASPGPGSSDILVREMNPLKVDMAGSDSGVRAVLACTRVFHTSSQGRAFQVRDSLCPKRTTQADRRSLTKDSALKGEECTSSMQLEDLKEIAGLGAGQGKPTASTKSPKQGSDKSLRGGGGQPLEAGGSHTPSVDDGVNKQDAPAASESDQAAQPGADQAEETAQTKDAEKKAAQTEGGKERAAQKAEKGDADQRRAEPVDHAGAADDKKPGIFKQAFGWMFGISNACAKDAKTAARDARAEAVLEKAEHVFCDMPRKQQQP